MANNDFDSAFNQFNQIINNYNSGLKNSEQAARELSTLSKSMLKALEGTLKDTEVAAKDILNQAKKISSAFDTAQESLISEIDDTKNDIDRINQELELVGNSNEDYRKRLEKELKDQIDHQTNLNDQYNKLQTDGLEGLKNTLNTQKAKDNFDKEKLEQDKKRQQELEKANKEAIDAYNKRVDGIAKGFEKGFTTVTDLLSSSISKVASVYNENASKMSALLNVSVQDIGSMQKTIASNLRETSLNRAISNVQVLQEASALTASGFTNLDTLQQNATDIAIGKQLAPNVDFNQASVKNLINVFGSDFTSKFSAITAAVQETAGSTVGLKETLNTLMGSLEPVFLNAELQANALQGTADVAATLSKAQQEGLITDTDAQQYRSMLTELMDPSKAFKSSNKAVLVAAAQNPELAFSGDPSKALQALISARQSLYANVGTSMSTSDVIGRSLTASAFGDNTMTASYNLKGLTGLTLQSTGDLGATYEEQLGKLKSGQYTTQTEATQNITENLAFTQGVSDFAKVFPNIYKTYSTLIIAAINSIPSRIGNKLHRSLTDFGSGGESGESSGDSGGTLTKGGKLSGWLRGGKTQVAGKGGLSPSGFSRTGGLATLSYGAALSGGMNLISSIGSNEDALQGFGFGGDVVSGITNYAGIGAGIGSLIGPGLGTVIGGAVGALAGLAVSAWAASEAQNKQKESLNKLTQETEEFWGTGITKLSESEAKAAVAKGGATMSLKDGSIVAVDKSAYGLPSAAVGMDYVPYDDYIVKLHRGEAVVTANAAKELRKSSFSFYNNPSVDNNDVVNGLEKQTRSIVSAIKGNGSDDAPMIKGQQGSKTYTINNSYA